MKTNTAKNIVEYIKTHKQSTAKELAEVIGISPQALFRHLAKLQEKGEIYKIGSSPKVFYDVVEQIEAVPSSVETVSAAIQKVIEENFLFVTPEGERKEGMSGFSYWCIKTGQKIEKTAEEYVNTLRKYHKFQKDGVVNGTDKLKSTFPDSVMYRLYYLDFYSIERFGKTKLGQLLLYAKQSQNKKLMRELITDIEPKIKFLIKKWNIDCVGFIPPTVKREVQFMKELERGLSLHTHMLPIVKVKTEIAIPQKTLSKLGDRIDNARKTIIVDSKNHFENILLIDDAVGSGATLNETAAQIRAKGLCRGRIIGVAITGSANGFDVISEV